MPLLDTLSRPLRNLRLSVTDRCNLRCQYCMPEDDYVWLPREDVLHFEEISVLVDVFLSLGVDKLRLTGGEPLLRRDLASLVRMLSVKAGLKDLAMTTNGVLLAEQIDGLKAAGLGRITVSLDTLKADRFVALARFDELARVKEGLEAASRAFSATPETSPSGFPGTDATGPTSAQALSSPADATAASPAGVSSGVSPSTGLKIDTVAIKGVNDDELVDLIEYGKTLNAEVRFIEYMDVGGATRWTAAGVISRREMLDRLAAHYGPIEPLANESSAPADQFRLPNGTVFGIISSTTEPFCRSCDRSRLTADGMWYLCLYASRGTDLRAAIRKGASADELRAIISEGWTNRSDRGAEVRLALGDRRASAQVIPVKSLRQDPHLEMHTRGG